MGNSVVFTFRASSYTKSYELLDVNLNTFNKADIK